MVERRTAKSERVRRGVVVLPRALEFLQLGEDLIELLGLRKMRAQNPVRVGYVCAGTVRVFGERLLDIVGAVEVDLDDASARRLDRDRNLPHRGRLSTNSIRALG